MRVLFSTVANSVFTLVLLTIEDRYENKLKDQEETR